MIEEGHEAQASFSNVARTENDNNRSPFPSIAMDQHEDSRSPFPNVVMEEGDKGRTPLPNVAMEVDDNNESPTLNIGVDRNGDSRSPSQDTAMEEEDGNSSADEESARVCSRALCFGYISLIQTSIQSGAPWRLIVFHNETLKHKLREYTQAERRILTLSSGPGRRRQPNRAIRD